MKLTTRRARMLFGATGLAGIALIAVGGAGIAGVTTQQIGRQPDGPCRQDPKQRSNPR